MRCVLSDTYQGKSSDLVGYLKAHAMSPHQGAGAGQAIEEPFVFRVVRYILTWSLRMHSFLLIYSRNLRHQRFILHARLISMSDYRLLIRSSVGPMNLE